MNPPTTAVGQGEIARELGVQTSTVNYWVKQGWVTVVQEADGPGKKKLLDRESVLAVARGKAGHASRRTTRKRPGRTAARGDHPATHRPTPPSHPPHTESGRSRHPPPATAPSPSESTSTSTPPRSANSSAFLLEWCAEGQVQGLSPETIEDRLEKGRRFVAVVGTLPVVRDDVLGYLATLKLAPQSRKDHASVIRAFLRWAEDVHGFPCPNFSRLMPRVQLAPPVFLEREELDRVLSETHNRHDRTLFRLLAYSGMRVGELCSLLRDRVRDDHVEVRGKTGWKRYEIKPEMAEDLRALGGHYVFVNRFGGQMTKSGIDKRFRRVLGLAGVHKDKKGVHILRHTFAVMTLRETGNLKLVQELLGHATIHMTLRYAQLVRADVSKGYQQLSFINGLEGGSDNGEPGL